MATAKKQAPPKKKTGRPSSYTEAQGQRICARIANGESLREICSGERMPTTVTVFRWLRDIEGFQSLYAHAREEQAELLAGEIIAIADESSRDTYIDPEGNERTNTEVVARSKLRVDARKWVASKLKPRVYGDKLQAEVTGKDGAPLFDPSKLSDADLASMLAMVAKGQVVQP